SARPAHRTVGTGCGSARTAERRYVRDHLGRTQSPFRSCIVRRFHSPSESCTPAVVAQRTGSGDPHHLLTPVLGPLTEPRNRQWTSPPPCKGHGKAREGAVGMV